ncbi:MAG: ATP-dependent RNA helicase DbpA [Proteobacteria bacterium]|nr:ATP-dependent RNA helicase DbpA [Pseudomonadota bacterium]
MSAPEATSFATLDLASAQLANLETLGYHSMTPIQAQSLPLVLGGRDLIARAKTGSGKTAAFGLGLLEQIDPRHFVVQALVLCPTRELADQVGKEIRRLAQGIPNVKLVSLCGGKPFGPQKMSLGHGAHIVVGTPGRILDHLLRGTLKLDGLKTLVLDEADRMLDMGFSDAMEQIVAKTPARRQTLLFSATYPEGIAKISRAFQRNPAQVTVEAEHAAGVIEQVFYEVRAHERNNALLALFEHFKPASTLVFCHTKKECAEVATFLNDHRIEALAIHGDLEQRDRDRVLVLFSNNSVPVLVATDVAARGLDIKSLQAVINYELPRQAEIYIHRIGRTGRAGEKGLAVSLFTQAEQGRVNAIEALLPEPCIYDTPASLDRQANFVLKAPMGTIEINTGRKQKVRPGDLLGALTGDAGLAGSSVGKIDIFDMASFVAIERSEIRRALDYFTADGKVKGRAVRARRVS